jgi:hypothetical protein
VIVEPGANPSAVTVTWPGAFTEDGFAETPLPRQLCALATVLRSGTTPAMERLWKRSATMRIDAQSAQALGIVSYLQK